MKIWLDTTNLETIQKAKNIGILYGITTNPAIIAASGKTLEKNLTDLLDCQEGPVAAQVIAHDLENMLVQAKALRRFSKRIIVKVPVSEAGLEAIHQLSEKGIPTMATTIFLPHQALMAALAGAHYVAPYIGQMEKNGQDPWSVLHAMTTAFRNYSIKTEILAASIPTLDHFQKCTEMAVPHITIKEPIFQFLTGTIPTTQDWMNRFSTTWEQANLPFLPHK